MSDAQGRASPTPKTPGTGMLPAGPTPYRDGRASCDSAIAGFTHRLGVALFDRPQAGPPEPVRGGESRQSPVLPPSGIAVGVRKRNVSRWSVVFGRRVQRVAEGRRSGPLTL